MARTSDHHDEAGRADGRPTWAGLAIVLGVALVVAATSLGTVAFWLASGTANRTSSSTSSTEASSIDGYTVWDRNDDGEPVRWDPCLPIKVVLSPEGAPSTAVPDLERALELLADATGLRLKFIGSTSERPSDGRPAYQPERYGERWAPVLVAWEAVGRSGLPLRDIDRGVAIPVAVGEDGDRTYVTGQVILASHRDDLRGGFSDRETSWGATLVHELGHVLGLGHVNDPDELMHVFPGSGPIELGPGDRSGLRAIGADGGCRDAAEPQPVQAVEAGS